MTTVLHMSYQSLVARSISFSFIHLMFLHVHVDQMMCMMVQLSATSYTPGGYKDPWLDWLQGLPANLGGV